MAEPVSLVLGPRYSADLWDLHKHLAGRDRRRDELVTVRVRAPINSEAVDVAVLSGSLYLVGVRGADGRWSEFANDAGLASSLLLSQAAPRLPGSRWIVAGGGRALSSYRALRLSQMMAFAASKREALGFFGSPVDLVRHFARWNGALNTDPERLRMCVLIMVVCEALRFRSVETACSNWINGRGPDAVSNRLVIDQETLDTVQNWRARALARDRNVTMAPPDLPDPLIG